MDTPPPSITAPTTHSRRGRLYTKALWGIVVVLMASTLVWRSTHFTEAVPYMSDQIVASLSDRIMTTSSSNNNNNNSRNWTSEWLDQGIKGKSPQILFAHIGKTGGGSFVLPQTKARYEGRKPPVLYQYVVCLAHIGQNHRARKDREVNTLLFPIRSPIARIVSTFNYHRNYRTKRKAIEPKKNETGLLLSNPRYNYDIDRGGEVHGFSQVFYFDCFQTIQDMAEVLLLSPSEVAGHKGLEVCRYIAHEILAGNAPHPPDKAGPLHHFTYNYQHHVNFFINPQPEVPVLAVRINHIMEDAHKLDVALGGNGTFPIVRESHGSENYTVQVGLEKAEHRLVVCCSLSWRELEAYQTIVLRALNLDIREKQELLQESMAECGAVVPPNSDPDIVHNPFSWKQWYEQSCSRFDFRFDGYKEN